MSPEDMAALYGAAFAQSRAWSAAEISGLLAQPTTFAIAAGAAGFALGRVVADEAELITLAVAPEMRRTGVGRGLLAGFEAAAKARGAVRALLEVAADNRAALGLYRADEWRESARRRGYYRRINGVHCDAIILAKALT